MKEESVWAFVREDLAGSLADRDLKIWIDPLQPLGQENGVLVLGCPNRFFLGWVKEKYLHHIKAALKTAKSRGYGVDSVDLKVAPPPDRPRSNGSPPQCQYELPKLEVHRRAPLRFNRRFTFDRFVVGAPNQFAYSAALAMANGQDLHTDSLFILSNTGLGKSHLSQAIGQHLLVQEPNKKVYYLTAEDFTNELVYAIKHKNTEEFKDKYRRGCDVLVLEDINFLSGKEKVQAELSYTLDSLIVNDKKIVFTSSQKPKDIPRLGRQFLSRLSSGLISTIEPPDFETRVQILKRKSEEYELSFSEEVLEFLAGRPTRDVRQMESSLFCLGAKSRLMGCPIDITLAKEVLEGLAEETNEINPAAVQELVCRYYQVSLEDFRSRSRRKNIVLSRNVGMYLCRKTTDLSLQAIGRAFGRNHSTVMYSINVIENRCRKDAKLKGQIEFLTCQLKGLAT